MNTAILTEARLTLLFTVVIFCSCSLVRIPTANINNRTDIYTYVCVCVRVRAWLYTVPNAQSFISGGQPAASARGY
jgi:hypothetical protein